MSEQRTSFSALKWRFFAYGLLGVSFLVGLAKRILVHL